MIYQLNSNLKFNLLDFSSYSSFNPVWRTKILWVLIPFVAVLLHIPFLQLKVTLYLIHLGIISTLYNVPKTKHKSFLPLRSIPILKIFIIAYVWASISSILPAIILGISIFTYKTILVFLAHFLFIFSITLPFDIRDYNLDSERTLVTMPHFTSIRTTKILALLCLFAFTIIIHSLIGGIYIILFSAVVLFLIINSSPSKKDYYFSFVLDGTIIFYYITILWTLN